MLLVGSGNPHKIEEIRAILADLPIAVVGTEILPGPQEDVPETGTTFEANVRIKALEYARRAARLLPAIRPRWVIADDSGLCVEALGGAPGVISARFAGPAATALDNNQKLLAALAGVATGARDAHFVCAVACAGVPEDGREPEILFVVEGRCPGRITDVPRGEEGFGYDPIFEEAESGRTFAELDRAAKSRRSHRGVALQAFRERFAALCG
jgi:XTP/dITP diphosphohydrolase